jgi:hypothetical protein
MARPVREARSDGMTTDTRRCPIEYETVDKAIEMLRAAAEGLTDATVEVEQEWDVICVYVTGRRPSTEAEIAQRDRRVARDREAQVERARRVMAEFPEAFT